MVALAGKAAVDVVYGNTDIGASADLRYAYSQVAELVDDLCTYGFDCAYSSLSAEKILENRDVLICSEVSRYYSEVKRMLIKNREKFGRIVDSLCENNVITYTELSAIMDY